jgi:hypothetical protein
MERTRVKIILDGRRAKPAPPDFAMLRASATAQQAATPTAIASRNAQPVAAPPDALVRLFDTPAGADWRPLRGSFHPAQADAARWNGTNPRGINLSVSIFLQGGPFKPEPEGA